MNRTDPSLRTLTPRLDVMISARADLGRNISVAAAVQLYSRSSFSLLLGPAARRFFIRSDNWYVRSIVRSSLAIPNGTGGISSLTVTDMKYNTWLDKTDGGRKDALLSSQIYCHFCNAKLTGNRMFCGSCARSQVHIENKEHGQ